MIKLKSILPIILVFLGSIGIIAVYIACPSNATRTRKLKAIPNEQEEIEPYKPIPFIDLNDKDAVEAELRKIKHYKAIEGETVRHSNPLEKEEEVKLRSLATDNIFDDVGIVDPYTTYYGSIKTWFVRSMKELSSNIILYPYSFNYTFENNGTTSTRKYTHGAFISLKPEEIEGLNIGLKTNNTLKVKKARALYDGDIAILSINGQYESMDNINYFTDSDDWCNYFSNYLYKGNCLGNFQAFNKSKTQKSDKTYVTLLNETDVKNGYLLDNDLPRFKILIVGDFILGSESLIKSKLEQKGINALRNYFNKGGVIFVDGKSGALFEDFELITQGTYDRSQLVAIENANRKTKVTGYENTNQPYSDKLDFKKQLTCTSVKSSTQVCISSTFYTKNKDPGMATILEIDKNNVDLKIKNSESGRGRNLTETEKANLVLISHKTNSNNGQLFVMNFNPMFAGSDRDIILNLLALALSKELYLNSRVTMNINSTEMPDMPIPAGEAGFNLQVKTLIHNLDDQKIENATVYAFLPENFEWTRIIPPKCSLSDKFTEIPKEISLKRSFTSNTNKFLLCKLGTLDTYEKFNLDIQILVSNYKSTQLKYNVLILEPIFSFINQKKLKNIYRETVKVNCEAAALLRVAINPDPSSFYPVKGEGQYVDNVVKIENKEQSGAFDVEYVGLIPLISPLTDGDDQRKTQWNLKIFVDYYNTYNNFTIPFPKGNDNDQDFIYTAYLQDKGAVIIAEWDSPVLPVKETITPEKAEGVNLDQDVNLRGINVGMITINKTSDVLRQVNYRQSDRFYKLASQRLMVFIDDTTPEGYKNLYKNKQLDKSDKFYYNGITAKREFLFTRSDLYFYNNENYVNPPGVTEEVVFSVDKLVRYKKNKEGCVSDRADARGQTIEEGFFTNQDPSKRDIILKPRIYSNELFELCNLTVIDPTEEGELEKYFPDSGFRVVHYLIPNVEKDTTNPSQIYKFVKVDDYNGYHEDYPLIKFLYVHSLEFVINSKTCLYGGQIVINLGEYTIPDIESVTVAPDQIAVYEIVYDKTTNVLTAKFRRGLMSNEQFGKDLNIKMNLENVKKGGQAYRGNMTVNFKIDEMKYDISYPPTYERYTNIINQNKTFVYESAWSYPALEIKTKLDRTLYGYETKEPYSRYGIYIQELEHRTVYGTAETHFQTKPGIVGNGVGFSMISNLGISSIPFIEYVTVGRGQVIPAGPSTSRATWKDVWGRVWHQPLRSVFPDVPPIPPPLKNFMMSTTYEILQKGKQIYEWPSDENAQVHLHIKLLNNYPKYFEITRCKENQIRFVPKILEEEHDRDYSAKCSAELEDKDFEIKDKVFLRQGGYASYGKCFIEEGSIVGGQKVENDLKDKVERAIVCADLTTPQKIQECEEELKDITTLHKVDAQSQAAGTTGSKWNYSPSVERYYPTGYIEEDMWDLTHIDYDNNNMDKAYKYHMDNLVPNYDNGIIKPHNTIAIPIYKGLGFSILYDKNNEMDYHGKKRRGWWSDNLQNKDDTLVAGQDVCNVISVDKETSIKDWVEGKDLKGNKDSVTPTVQEIVNDRNKNIYVCLYNRKRPNFGPDTNKKYYTGNVNQNNIVPIIVNLDKNDKRLYNYDCQGEQYTPDNLYTMEENLLVTPTSKDYLYFAANLRGQAKESFNVLMNLYYFDQVKYEGMIKVNEGGRFVYWNPANGPNSFLVVDNPVSIVNAKRIDIEVENGVFPVTVDTFDSVVYHFYTFKDPSKINQLWPFRDFYANSFGFGDVSISVYVGGTRKSKAVLQPGQTTYAKIIFYNNCGFDWSMKKGAIEFEEKGTKPISAYDLLERQVHTIKSPLKYNFFVASVNKEYEPYLTITPSDHNIEVAPEFFDFENINVVTIRDGFKGEYNLKIQVNNTFPQKLRGKPIEIKLTLNTSYFDMFPGTKTDPIKDYHPYEVKIPSVFIAVPFNTTNFTGKVLYTSAQAKDLDLSMAIGVDWKTEGVKYISQAQLEEMREATQKENVLTTLDKLWNKLTKNVTFSEKPINADLKNISFDGIKTDYPLFPKINQGAPDTAEISVLIKSFAKQLPAGTSYPVSGVRMNYKKWNNNPKSADGERPFIYGEGPWLTLNYKRVLVEKLPNGDYIEKANQELLYEDEGVMRVDFTLKNIGNKDTYKTKYEIRINQNLTYIAHDEGLTKVSQKVENGKTVLTFDLNAPINSGESFGSSIYLYYNKYIESYEDLSLDEKKKLPNELKIVQEASSTFDFTKNETEKQVTQYLRTPLNFAYTKRSIRDSDIFMDIIVSGRRSNPTIEIVPKVKLVNVTKEDMRMKITKVDTAAQASDKNVESIPVYPSRLDRFGLITDSIDEKTVDDHAVVYVAQLDKSDHSPNFLSFDKNEIGLSTAEIVLIILSVIFYLLAFGIAYLAIKNMMRLKSGQLETQVKSGKIDKLLE